jgi:hypothetical protein
VSLLIWYEHFPVGIIHLLWIVPSYKLPIYVFQLFAYMNMIQLNFVFMYHTSYLLNDCIYVPCHIILQNSAFHHAVILWNSYHSLAPIIYILFSVREELNFLRNLDEGKVWKSRGGKQMPSLLKKCLRFFVLILLLIYKPFFVTIAQSLGDKVLVPEKLEVCELFCTRKIIYILWQRALLNSILNLDEYSSLHTLHLPENIIALQRFWKGFCT